MTSMTRGRVTGWAGMITWLTARLTTWLTTRRTTWPTAGLAAALAAALISLVNVGAGLLSTQPAVAGVTTVAEAAGVAEAAEAEAKPEAKIAAEPVAAATTRSAALSRAAFQLNDRLPSRWPAAVSTDLRQQLLAEQADLLRLIPLLEQVPAQIAIGAIPTENWRLAQTVWTQVNDTWSQLIGQLQVKDGSTVSVEALQASGGEVAQQLAQLWALVTPARDVEGRVLALDAGSFSRAYKDGDLDLIVQIAKGTGFNMIFVEVQRDDGYVIYPSKLWPEAAELVAASQAQAGSAAGDPLAEFIAKAHEQGIAVFPWVKLLFATANGQLGPVLTPHPDWAAVTQDRKVPTTPYNLVWFNPAHPGVRDFLASWLQELAQKYAIDGVQMDYVRYPNQYGVSTDYSYDDVTVAQVQSLYGFDPRTVPRPPLGQMGSTSYQVGDLPTALQEWNAYREEMVTSLLGRVVRAMQRTKPGLPISVAPLAATWGGGTYQQALVVHQNWPVWLDRHLAQLLSPLTYTDQSPVVTRELGNIQTLAAGRAMAIPSLSVAQTNLTLDSATELLRQIVAVQQRGASGYRIFAYPYLRLEHWRAFRQVAFSRPAINPALQPAAAAAELIADLQKLAGAILAGTGGLADRAARVAGLASSSLQSLQSLQTTLQSMNGVVQRLVRDERARQDRQSTQAQGVPARQDAPARQGSQAPAAGPMAVERMSAVNWNSLLVQVDGLLKAAQEAQAAAVAQTTGTPQARQAWELPAPPAQSAAAVQAQTTSTPGPQTSVSSLASASATAEDAQAEAAAAPLLTGSSADWAVFIQTASQLRELVSTMAYQGRPGRLNGSLAFGQIPW